MSTKPDALGDRLKSYEAMETENVLNAIVWTTTLVANLIAWPIVLCMLVWYKVFPDDFVKGMK